MTTPMTRGDYTKVEDLLRRAKIAGESGHPRMIAEMQREMGTSAPGLLRKLLAEVGENLAPEPVREFDYNGGRITLTFLLNSDVIVDWSGDEPLSIAALPEIENQLGSAMRVAANYTEGGKVKTRLRGA